MGIFTELRKSCRNREDYKAQNIRKQRRIDEYKEMVRRFEPMAERLALEGMSVERIAKAFYGYVLCKSNNAKDGDVVEFPETFDHMRR